MNLIDYARILLRRGWIIILLAVIGAGSAYFFSNQQTTIWRATQRVLVQPIRADLSLTESAKSLLAQYAAYLDSEFMAQRVIETLDLDMLPSQLMGAVDIAPIDLSVEIRIDVDLPQAEVAAAVAQEWGLLLVDYRNRENQAALRQDRILATLQDNPAISLVQPRPTIYAVAGGVLGALVGGILVLVLEYLESNIVRRREDLERTDMPVLAAIPHIDG